MDSVFKAAALAISAAIMALVLRRRNPEIALCLTLCACVLLLIKALNPAPALLELISRARELSGLNNALFAPLIKCVGIGIVARLGADSCRDAGSAGLASAVELSGALAAVFTALPLFSALLGMVEELT